MNLKPMILALVLGLVQEAPAATPVDYLRDVKPILAARCYGCHGAIRQKAGLRLDTADFIRRGGDGGPAVEPGKSGESLLIDRVTAADGPDRMPPESEGEPLGAAEVATLRAWIDQGAEAPRRADPRGPPRALGLPDPGAPGSPAGRRTRPGSATRSTPSSPPGTGHAA